jgi:hypothetical protein
MYAGCCKRGGNDGNQKGRGFPQPAQESWGYYTRFFKGGNIISLRWILGHSTLNMTLRYAHLAPDFLASEIKLLNFDAASSLSCPWPEVVS